MERPSLQEQMLSKFERLLAHPGRSDAQPRPEYTFRCEDEKVWDILGQKDTKPRYSVGRKIVFFGPKDGAAVGSIRLGDDTKYTREAWEVSAVYNTWRLTKIFRPGGSQRLAHWGICIRRKSEPEGVSVNTA